MVVSVDTCVGPRAYAGVVFTFNQQLESGFTRLDDEQWTGRVSDGLSRDEPWLGPVLAAP